MAGGVWRSLSCSQSENGWGAVFRVSAARKARYCLPHYSTTTTLYETIYDIRTTSSVNWYIALWGVAFIVFGVWLVVSDREKAPHGRPLWLRIAWLTFAVLWTALGVGLPLFNHISHSRALTRGDVRVADGRITNFRSSSDCKDERFTVAAHSFEYSFYEEMGRFNRPKPCGGPLRPGMQVRISYVNDDDIVKIEKRVQVSP